MIKLKKIKQKRILKNFKNHVKKGFDFSLLIVIVKCQALLVYVI